MTTNGLRFEDSKRVIRISQLKEQHNGQKKKDKRTNKDLQSMAHKDRVTRIPLKPGVNSRVPER